MMQTLDRAADFADELFRRACRIEYAPTRVGAPSPTPRSGRRRRSLMHHSLLHRPHRPRIHRRTRRLGGRNAGRVKWGKTPTATPLFELGQQSETAHREASDTSGGEISSAPKGHRPWSARPLPPPLGIEKLKDYDGPTAAPETTKSYASLSTAFPSLGDGPSADPAPRALSLRVQPSTTIETTSSTAESHRRVLRELVAWYFYARGGAPNTLCDCAAPADSTGERVVNSNRPVKSMLLVGETAGNRLDSVVEEDEDGTVDVWKGIGTKGFTFALSNRERRSVGKSTLKNSEDDRPVLPPPPPHTAAPQRTSTSHRARRVSLSPGLLLMSPSSAELYAAAPSPLSRSRESSSNVQISPEQAPVQQQGQKKHERGNRKRNGGGGGGGGATSGRLPKSLGTSLGPWVSHDPDLCDSHDHSRYRSRVAGSAGEYALEHAKGWTSHERLKSFVWDVATAEGGEVMLQGKKVSFSGLFERLLLVDPKEKSGEKAALGKAGAAARRESLRGGVDAALGLV